MKHILPILLCAISAYSADIRNDNSGIVWYFGEIVSPTFSGYATTNGLADLREEFDSLINTNGITAEYADLHYLPLTWPATNSIYTQTVAKASSAVQPDMSASLSNLTVNTLQLNTNFNNGHAIGRIQWNSDDKTAEVGLGGGNVNIQLGLETVFIALNKTGGTIANGTPVAITGAQGQRVTIAPADADAGEILSKVAGIATEDITNNATGYVTSEGVVRDLNTQDLVAGNELFLSTSAGFLTTNHPSPPVDAMSVGFVRNSHPTSGEIQVHIKPCFHWADMDNRFVDQIETQIVYMANNVTVASNFYISGVVQVTNAVWDDLTVGALTLVDPQGALSSARIIQITNNLYGNEFSPKNVGYGKIQMPHTYKVGSAIYPHIHVSHTNALTTTNIWCLGLSWGRIGGEFTNHYYQEITVTNAPVATGRPHRLYPFPVVSTTTNTLGQSSIVGFVISNKAVSTHSGIITDIDFHFQRDKLGSQTEIPDGI